MYQSNNVANLIGKMEIENTREKEREKLMKTNRNIRSKNIYDESLKDRNFRTYFRTGDI